MFDGFVSVLLPDYQTGRDTLRASDRWELRSGAAGRNGPPNVVYLNLRSLFGHDVSGGTSLEAERQANEVVLAYFEIDLDLDQKISYTKCSASSARCDPPACWRAAACSRGSLIGCGRDSTLKDLAYDNRARSPGKADPGSLLTLCPRVRE
jgi:hypothetical protein